MFDPAKIYADALASLCETDEHVVAALSVNYTSGQELSATPESNDVTIDPLVGLDVPAWNRGAERLVAGVSLDARFGRDAATLAAAADAPMVTLAFSNRRLFVADVSAGVPPSTTWARPLGAVSAVTWSPRFLQFGRIEVGFRDGSAVQLMGGAISPMAARRFVSAWNSP